MPPLTAEMRASQAWVGRAEAVQGTDPQQLCDVRVPEDMARPWLLTVYAQRSGGGLIVPTMPAGPSSAVAPVYTVPTVPASLRVQIGVDTITMDYPARGATYGISPASQVNVQLIASWAGLVEPVPHPVYQARITEAEGTGVAQSTLATPRYTYAVGQLEVAAAFYGLVPMRAHAATLYPGADLTGTEVFTLAWFDDAGVTIASHSLKPGGGPAAGDAGGHELTPWAIPPRATQWSLALSVGVNDVPDVAMLFHLSL